MSALGSWVKAKLGILDRFMDEQETLNDQVIAVQGNAGYHNSIYRGKNLGNTVTDEMYASITAGTFDDMFVGDYFTINGRVYRIAGFNLIKNCGDNISVGNCVCIVPDAAMGSYAMNSTNTTEGGYVNSEMRTTHLASVSEIVETDFGSSHVLSYRDTLTTATTDGQASAWAWVYCKVELMSEVMLFGTKIWANSGYEIGCLNEQFPLFRLNPESIHRRIVGSFWLRNVISENSFSLMSTIGRAIYQTASSNYAIIPFFFIVENDVSAVTLDEVEEN